MTIVAVVQARLGSTRFPGKVMANIDQRPLIEVLIERLSLAESIDQIIVATTTNRRDDILVDFVRSLSVEVFRGDEDDVLDRYYKLAVKYKLAHVVRITGDCPVIDPQVVDLVVGAYGEGKVDFASNIDPRTWPDGLDTEVFTFALLENTWRTARSAYLREHVTPSMRNSLEIRKTNVSNEIDISRERWTVDEPLDMKVVRDIVRYFSPSVKFSWQDILEMMAKHPEMFKDSC